MNVRFYHGVSAAVLAMSLVLSGCSSGPSAEAKANAKKEIKEIQAAMSQSETVTDFMLQYIDWQVSTSEAEMTKQHEAIDAGIAYVPIVDPQTQYDQVKTIADELAGYGNNLQGLLDQMKLYADTGIEQVDATRDAGIEYLTRMTSAIKDLLSISDFYMAEFNAFAPIRAIDINTYTDRTVYASDMTDAFGMVYEASQKIDCPEYMSQPWQQYMKQIANYEILWRSMYVGWYLDDPLRQAANIYMSQRVDKLLVKYGDKLTVDFSLQFTQVGSRLNTEIATLKKELNDACAKLASSL